MGHGLGLGKAITKEGNGYKVLHSEHSGVESLSVCWAESLA